MQCSAGCFWSIMIHDMTKDAFALCSFWIPLGKTKTKKEIYCFTNACGVRISACLLVARHGLWITCVSSDSMSTAHVIQHASLPDLLAQNSEKTMRISYHGDIRLRFYALAYSFGGLIRPCRTGALGPRSKALSLKNFPGDGE